MILYGNNLYGHPNGGVVQDLLNHGENLYSTYEQRSIEVSTVGNSYTINVDPWGAKPEPAPAPSPKPESKPQPEPNPEPKPGP